jgi:uncharacterized membrane protein/predicted DsbA family dithiol-disulfide isomerase
MSNGAARFLLLCAIVGLLASGTSSYVHYRMLADPTYSSFCDVNASVSCTDAYASRFGAFRGIPVAVIGAVWFAFAALLSLVGLTARPDIRESAPGYLFAGSTLALAVVLYLGYASFVILKVMCVLCLVTYAAVLGLFLISGSATPFAMTSLPRRAVRDLKALVASPIAIAVTVLFLGGAVSALAFFPREGGSTPGEPLQPVSQDQRSELERFMSTATRVPLVIPSMGAKVVVVKFNDYQCPACAQSHQAYKPVLAKYEAQNPGQVRLVMRDYPLDTACNANMTRQLHPAACDAAVAVRLARRHGRAEPLEEWLYTHQEQMTAESVRQAAREIGQVSDFDQQYASTLESVKADIALGRELRVSSTPTFFLNGIKIDGSWAPQFFDQAIAYELQHAN